jgi:hypothetical protein
MMPLKRRTRRPGEVGHRSYLDGCEGDASTDISFFFCLERVSPSERGKLLMKLADLMEAHADELAALETLDNGKAFSVSESLLSYAKVSSGLTRNSYE